MKTRKENSETAGSGWTSGKAEEPVKKSVCGQKQRGDCKGTYAASGNPSGR